MTYSVKDLQKRYGVGEHTVLDWVNSGLLKRLDVSRSESKRPKYRFTQEHLDEFEQQRSGEPKPKKKQTRRRKTAAPAKEWF